MEKYVAGCKEEAKKPEKEKEKLKYAVFDIEATNWIHPYLLGRYDGTDFIYFRGSHCIRDYLEWEFNSKPLTVFAHNGGGYDFKFLLKYILENKERLRLELTPIFINGKAISIKIYRKSKSGKTRKLIKHFRDSYAIMPDSLRRLTKSLEVEHKKLMMPDEDYNDSSITFEKLKYLEHDCKGLYECIVKFVDFSGLHYRLPLTIASCAMKVYLDRFQPDFGNIIKSHRFIEPDIRQAYYGGRVEVIRRYGEILHYYDVNSLYPCKMTDSSYPTGEHIKVSQFSDNMLGVYKCKVKAPELDILLLPCRKDGMLIFGRGEFEGWYTTPEIKKALSIGYEINIDYGYVWTESSDTLFNDYVNYFYGIKSRATGAKRVLAKLFLNSLYGKFGQNRNRDKILFEVKESELMDVRIIDEELGIYSKGFIQKFGDYLRPIIAIFVTAYSRIHIYEVMEKAGFEHVYYGNTDSLVTDIELKTGTKIGELKEEYTIKKGIFLQPKLYSFITANGDCVTRGKGFDVKKLKYEYFEMALFGKNYAGFTQGSLDVLGFFESFKNKNSDNILALDWKRKTNKGTFLKRRLLSDNINTKPLRLRL